LAFRIDPREPVEQEVRRAALEQIDRALAEIDDSDLDTDKTVHQVRKRCKKLRGLLRLIRYRFKGDYKAENAWYRDAAAELSALRDSQVLGGTFDNLTLGLRATADAGTLQALREQLLTGEAPAQGETGPVADDALQAFRAKMQAGRERIGTWRLEKGGFAALRPGLKANYRRGRKAMERAFKQGDDASFHDWRKRVKYHTYHLHLFTRAWSRPLGALEKEASALGDILGEDHDLAVLAQALATTDTTAHAGAPAGKVQELLENRQRELRARARHLGARLFAEKPKAFCGRIESYWDAG